MPEEDSEHTVFAPVRASVSEGDAEEFREWVSCRAVTSFQEIGELAYVEAGSRAKSCRSQPR
jgi:hypothetical protein